MPRWQTKKTGHRSSLFRVDFWIEQFTGMRARFAMPAHITGSPSVGEHQFIPEFPVEALVVAVLPWTALSTLLPPATATSTCRSLFKTCFSQSLSHP